MSIETALFLLGISGFLISGLLTGIGYFVVRYLKNSDANFESLALSLEGIKSDLGEVVERLTKQEQRAHMGQKNCERIHDVIDKKFEKQEKVNKDIENRVDDCEKEIIKISK